MNSQANEISESGQSLGKNEWTIPIETSSRENGKKLKTWNPESPLLVTGNFASVFYLLHEYEFSASMKIPAIVEQAKLFDDKCRVEQRQCIEAIHFICIKNSYPEFSHTCCRILDLYTNCTSASLHDYMRHSRYKALLEIRPLDAYQEDVVIALADYLANLLQNHRIALQDSASRTLCRFIVHFYRIMSLYMFLLKEQEKEIRSKHLKYILDQRRMGLKESLELSIAPLLDSNFAISCKSEVIQGGLEFMNRLNADEDEENNFNRDSKMFARFFHIWSRYISFKKLSISAIVHSLMKLMLKFCQRWSIYVFESKIVSRNWHKMSKLLSVYGEQNRICDVFSLKIRLSIRNGAFVFWKHISMICKHVAKNNTSKVRDNLLHWKKVTKMCKYISESSRRLLRLIFSCWKMFVCARLSFSKALDAWVIQYSRKTSCRGIFALFKCWKRWYFARWVARKYLNKRIATRALNAWIEYQISFIQKMISCASRARVLRDTSCLSSHFKNWKLRLASKKSADVFVVIQRVRIWLRLWNRRCGFGVFQSGSGLTISLFCFSRWNKVTGMLRQKRHELKTSFINSKMKKICTLQFQEWRKLTNQRFALEQKASNLILKLKLKPSVLHLIRHQNVQQRTHSCNCRLKRSMLLAWKRFVVAKVLFTLSLKRLSLSHWKSKYHRSRSVHLFAYKVKIWLLKRSFLQFKLRCRKSLVVEGNDSKLKQLAFEFRMAHREKMVGQAKYMTKKQKLTMNESFEKWRKALQDDNKLSFLELMFRCGEINVMRRHFNVWSLQHNK